MKSSKTAHLSLSTWNAKNGGTYAMPHDVVVLGTAGPAARTRAIANSTATSILFMIASEG